jgi:hypothetical protein
MGKKRRKRDSGGGGWHTEPLSPELAAIKSVPVRSRCQVTASFIEAVAADAAIHADARAHNPGLSQSDLEVFVGDTIRRALQEPQYCKFDLDKGRAAFYDSLTGRLVIHNPNANEKSTTFRPDSGVSYFNSKVY